MQEVHKELLRKVKYESNNSIVYFNDYGDGIAIQIGIREQICYLPECKWITRKGNDRKIFNKTRNINGDHDQS